MRKTSIATSTKHTHSWLALWPQLKPLLLPYQMHLFASLIAVNLPKHQASYFNLNVQVMTCCRLPSSFLLLEGKALELGSLWQLARLRCNLYKMNILVLDNAEWGIGECQKKRTHVNHWKVLAFNGERQYVFLDLAFSVFWEDSEHIWSLCESGHSCVFSLFLLYFLRMWLWCRIFMRKNN